MSEAATPLIVLTVTDPRRHADSELAIRKNELYAESITRNGGRPLLIDESSSDADRGAAMATMDGLLLTGGADIDPVRYGRPNRGSTGIEPERDALEAEAWAAAKARGVPVLGICRGFQAINVFSGGTLLQEVSGHAGPGWGSGAAKMHVIRLDGESRVSRALGGATEAGVNTYHHQAVTADDLAPELRATAWAASPTGELVEALELPGDRFVVGIQCHPERTEFSPAALEGLWAAFVDACREASASARSASRGRVASSDPPRAGTERQTAGRSR
jgi:gamma-glutamyl-gamma-aminobutyrate hydrolase PuuD